MFARNRISSLLIKRQIHGNTEIVENCKEVRNRNPRNLERLRIARKPIGYFLDKHDISYWHKLVIRPSQRYVVAEISHFENGTVISVSSKEWGIRKQLYSAKDAAAYRFVGRVLAQRCLECGISEIHCNQSEDSKKEALLVNELVENGISLKEPSVYKHPTPTYTYRPEKPWDSFE